MKRNKASTFGVIALSWCVLSCGPQQDSEADGSAAAGAGAVRTVPVEAMVVRTETVEETVEVTGVIVPHRAVDVVAEIGGRLTRVLAEVGHRVRTGDTLAVIDDRVPESRLEHAFAQVLSSRNKLKIARLNFKSDHQLFEHGDISQLAFENSRFAVKEAEAELKSNQADLSRARKEFEDTRLTSPIDGWISRKHVELGTMITVGAATYRVVNLDTMKVTLGIPQTAIGRVREGAPVRITVAGGQTFEGHVRHISPQAEEATGAFPVEVHVTNTADTSIRAGMSAHCRVMLSGSRLQFVVPGDAVLARDGQEHVYRIREGIARLTGVKTRETFSSRVAVEMGLAEGDTIVVVGMKRLGVETPVAIRALR